jgi:ATP-dependent Clp protease ATP-binding subunit ClpX
MKAGSAREDVGNIIPHLIQAADYEIDKIKRITENIVSSHDVFGECVHQALLQMLEGTSFNVSPRGGRKEPKQEYAPVDMRKILFISGEAFSDLETIAKECAVLQMPNVSFASPGIKTHPETRQAYRRICQT